MRTLWQLVRTSSKAGCQHLGVPEGDSISIWMRWLGGNERAYNCDLPTSFWRWSLMGVRSAITSISSEKDVLKVPSIYMVALLYILPRILSGYDRGVQL